MPSVTSDLSVSLSHHASLSFSLSVSLSVHQSVNESRSPSVSQYVRQSKPTPLVLAFKSPYLHSNRYLLISRFSPASLKAKLLGWVVQSSIKQAQEKCAMGFSVYFLAFCLSLNKSQLHKTKTVKNICIKEIESPKNQAN